MADNWKQTWKDILNALRGENAKEVEPTLEGDERPPSEDVGNRQTFDPAFVEESSQEEQIVLMEPAPAEPSADTIQLIESDKDSEEPEISPASQTSGGSRRGESNVFLYAVLASLLIAGLWFSGGNQLLARWLAPAPPAPNVIATFNGGQITTTDIEEHLKLLVPEEYQAIVRSPDLLIQVVDDLLMDELARRWAEQRQPDRDEEFSHTMQHISEGINLQSLDVQLHQSDIPVAESDIQNYYQLNKTQFGDQPLNAVREQIRQQLVAEQEKGYVEDYIQRLKDNASITRNFELLDVPDPVEDDMRRYYDANLDQFKLPRQFNIDELRFTMGTEEAASRKNADDALLKLRSGATFEVAAQDTIDGTLTVGALVSEGDRDPDWDRAVLELTEGELSDVFRAADAFYIVRLNELQPARTQSLDEVRSTIRAIVQQQKMEEWFQSNGMKTLFTLKGKQYGLGSFYKEYKELPMDLQAQYSGSKGMQDLAEQLIERLLLVEDSYDQLLDTQNKPLTDEARLQVIKQMLHQEEIDDQIQVPEEEMLQFYNENANLLTLPPKARIRYIRIGLGANEDEMKAAQTKADEAYQKLVPGLLQKGADFAEIAQQYSEDPDSAAKGGEYPGLVGESEDLMTEIQLHPFHEKILTLPINEISRPFQVDDSLYIVQVNERTEPEKLLFEKAKPYIQELLTQQKHNELLTQLSKKLFQQNNVVLFESVLQNYFDNLGSATLQPGGTSGK